MDPPPPLEPWLADLVEASVAPYRGQVPDDDLAFVREQLAARLRSDPELARLARDARPRGPVDESGKIRRRDVLEGHALDGSDAEGHALDADAHGDAGADDDETRAAAGGRQR